MLTPPSFGHGSWAPLESVTVLPAGRPCASCSWMRGCCCGGRLLGMARVVGIQVTRGLERKVTFPLFFLTAGVEDGQTVRMPVGKKEIFITFRVRIVILLAVFSI